jgi:hypothetical protein
MQPREQTLDLPTTPVTAQHPAVLHGFAAARGMMRRNQLHAEALANPRVPGIAVVSAFADQSWGSFGNESLLDRGFDELGFMRRNAGHVHGERKAMAVADRHDFIAFAAASGADSRAPFFAERKLASMNDSLRSNFPRSRKSSARNPAVRIGQSQRIAPRGCQAAICSHRLIGFGLGKRMERSAAEMDLTLSFESTV